MNRSAASQRVRRGRVVAALVHAGWRPPPLTDAQATRLLDDMRSISHLKPNATLELAPSERRVLQLIANGANEHEVAADCHVTRETVKTQTKQIRRKLGANSTTHAVAIGLREGVIE